MTRDRWGTLIVAVAAAAWGLDGLLRRPLATELAPATLVFWEHLVAVVVLLPFAPSAVRAFLRLAHRQQLAVAAIGVGASAGATALFTEAFAISARSGDYVTPIVLQKLQPLFAIGLAVLLLRERLRPRFGLYLVPALIGAWLVAFGDPFDVGVEAARSALFAAGAALLWGAGTVLGRYVSPSLGWRDLTVLRYLWGLPAALVITWVLGSPYLPGRGDLGAIVLLALIPGVGALFLYYVGLRRTAASRATLAELAFPVTAALVGVLFLHTPLTWSQWLGLGLTVLTVGLLGVHETRSEHPAVIAEPAEPAVHR